MPGIKDALLYKGFCLHVGFSELVKAVSAFLLCPNQRALSCVGTGAPQSSSTDEQILKSCMIMSSWA